MTKSREELIGTITNLLCVCQMTPDGERNPCPTCMYYGEEIGKVADFIIADRARIVEPLVKLSKEKVFMLMPRMAGKTTWANAIDETLRRAGIEEGI